MPDQPRTDTAAWFEENRDSLVDWEEVPDAATAAPKRRRAAMVSARFSRDEVAALRAAAEARGISLSALVRRAALELAGVEPAEGRPATAADIRQIVREELAAERRSA